MLRQHRYFGVNILNADQADIADRFSGKDRLNRRRMDRTCIGCAATFRCAGGDRMRGGGHHRAALACRHHRPELFADDAALAYWQGNYVAIDREEDMARLADVILPAGHVRESGGRFSRREG